MRCKNHVELNLKTRKRLIKHKYPEFSEYFRKYNNQNNQEKYCCYHVQSQSVLYRVV